jgi:site-specific recombinase XerD
MAAMTVDEAIGQFLEHIEVEKGAAPLTVDVYRRYLRRFSEWLAATAPQTRLEDIDLELVRKYRLYLSRLTAPDGSSLKKVTQSYYTIALRSLLRYLVVQRNITTLPPDKIDLPRSASRAVAFLNTDQMGRLLGSPDTSTVIGLRDRAILEMLFSTGLRVSELARLNRDQVDLERREFGVVGKGSKPRVVFLSDGAVEWIRRYLDTREDHFKPLFIRYAGGVDISKDGQKMRLTPRSIQLIVSKYARMCGLPVKATPHTLRHSFATDLLSAGADIRSVQEMLGHESIRTTQVYTHVTDRQLREVHRAFHDRKKADGGAPEDEPPGDGA